MVGVFAIAKRLHAPSWGFLYSRRGIRSAPAEVRSAPPSGYSQSLRDCMPLSRKLSRRGSLRSSVGVFAIAALCSTPCRGIRSAPAEVRSAPPSGYSQSLRSAQPPVGVFAPPPPRFAPLLRRGIRNRCALLNPLSGYSLRPRRGSLRSSVGVFAIAARLHAP